MGTSLQLPDRCVLILFHIIRAYAAFPFPASELGLTMNFDDFARSIRVLCDPEHLDCSTQLSGAWGPHSGMTHIGRTRTAHDARRLLFRSLSSPLDLLGESFEYDSKDSSMKVTAFSYFLENSCSDDNTALQEVKVLQKEDERQVDALDVLSRFLGPPRWISAPPSRRVYVDVLPLLPLPKIPLHELQVARTDLKELLRLSAWKVTSKWSLDTSILDDLSEILVTAFGDKPQVTWGTFDTVFANSLV